MRIQIDTEELARVLKACCQVAPRNHPKEVLRCIKMQADANVVLTATDMEFGIRIEANGCSIEEPGELLLSAHLVSRIVSNVTDETLTIENEGNGVTIRTVRDKFALPTMDPDEFPAIESIGGDREVTLSGDGFTTMVKRTSFCCDFESNRYALGGVMVNAEDHELTMVGTDGRRLSSIKTDGTTSEALAEEPWGEGTCIVPQKSIALMAAMAGETVTLRRDLNRMEMESDGVLIVSRLVEGRFPNWRQVIPDTSDYEELEVPSGMLSRTVRKAAIVCDRETKGVDFDFVDGTLTVTGSTQSGSITSEMPVSLEAEPIVMTLDNAFVQQICNILEPEDLITLNIRDHKSPILITFGGLQHVIMPMERHVEEPEEDEEESETEEAPTEEPAEA